MLENFSFDLVNNRLCNVLCVFFVYEDFRPREDLFRIWKILFIFIENNLMFVVRLFLFHLAANVFRHLILVYFFFLLNEKRHLVF